VIRSDRSRNLIVHLPVSEIAASKGNGPNRPAAKLLPIQREGTTAATSMAIFRGESRPERSVQGLIAADPQRAWPAIMQIALKVASQLITVVRGNVMRPEAK
jgi:hypothetical protein